MLQLGITSNSLILLQTLSKVNGALFMGKRVDTEDHALSICSYGSGKLFSFFRAAGVDLTRTDRAGNGCLHYAAKYGNLDVTPLSSLLTHHSCSSI